MLVDKEIKELIDQKEMIQNYKDLDIQIQPNGFDLSLGEVFTFGMEESIIDFSNKNRQIASHVIILPASHGQYKLGRGVYLFEANEFVQMPVGIVGFGLPRSSLCRAGGLLSSALIDAGYSGHLVFSIYIGSPMVFEKNARFAQLIFFKLDKLPSKNYQGVYKERSKK